MDMDETETGIHTSDHSREDTERMAPETAFHTMAPDTEASCAMDIGKLQRELTLHDLMDFMKRTKWKMYQRSNRRECVANYLTVIDTER